MAHVPLIPIGRPRRDFCDDRTFGEHHAETAQLESTLEARQAEVRAGWGPSYVERVHKKGKRTARERVTQLTDPGSEFFEVGTFVNYGDEFQGGLKSPAAGVVTGFGRVENRWCMIIANDNTVASGSWWPRTPEKIQRAQTMALKLRLPTIYLVDCSGLFLPEQSRAFPGAQGAGHIFKMNSLLSANGVPQLAGVFGDCIAGGGYMPIISDRVYMTEQAYMVIAGAALIKGAKSQKLTSLSIGGPEIHVHVSGCADVRVPDDDVLIDCLRREVRSLPSSAADYYRADARTVPPAYPPSELSGVVPRDHREAYDAHEVIARLVDQSLFWEILPDVGTEMICGVARIGGLYAGIVINRQGLIDDADDPSKKRPSAMLYRDGIAKISEFSRTCNADGIPLIWLQDISGFDIGTEAERHGLLGYGSNLIYTNSTNDVPMFTVLLRKASGAGYYAMNGLPFDPVVQLSTCISRLSVMEGRTLAIATYNTKLDDDFQIVTKDPTERADIEKGMREVSERIERDMDPYAAARQMDTDEVVHLAGLRDWLAVLVESSYQSMGHRRIKNPRIWAMHDVAALGRGRRAAVGASTEAAKSAEAKAATPKAKLEGTFVRAPMAGRYYGRPSPDAPPFVAVGQTVKTGDTVALLEIMKTFTRLTYGDDTLPAQGRIAEILPKEGEDVAAGDPILRLEEGK